MGLELRQWRLEDADAQARTIEESLDHLRPWMAWAVEWPKPREAHLATEVARQLCERAFADPAIDRVEVHHDRANVASAGVPRKLGFELVGDTPRAPQAPGEEGVERVWRVSRAGWTARRAAPPPGRS
jgi:RimJ/RimL family protein N-acetyltransferase